MIGACVSGVPSALSYSLPQTPHWAIFITLSTSGSNFLPARYLPQPRSAQTPQELLEGQKTRAWRQADASLPPRPTLRVFGPSRRTRVHLRPPPLHRPAGGPTACTAECRGWTLRSGSPSTALRSWDQLRTFGLGDPRFWLREDDVKRRSRRLPPPGLSLPTSCRRGAELSVPPWPAPPPSPRIRPRRAGVGTDRRSSRRGPRRTQCRCP
jgi:hypothetical protein